MAKGTLSKTQVDRLGERLKAGSHTEGDFRLLDEYRQSFGEASEMVVRAIRQLGEEPTERRAKTTQSITGKLRRGGVRNLSEMQDIAGCRVVVGDIARQNAFLAALLTSFPDARVKDRRDKPVHGYRAVHVIARVSGRCVEIQVRTAHQHRWAELSEKAADVLDPAIKYGGGPQEWQEILARASRSVASDEWVEGHLMTEVSVEKREERQEEVLRARQETADQLADAVSLLTAIQERQQ